MSSLYKHIPDQFAEAFRTGKSVRVGTLHEFRNEEKYEDKIGDHLEGAFKRNLHWDKPVKINAGSDIANKFSQAKLIHLAPGVKDIELTAINSSFIETVDDYYVFCTSISESVDLGYGKTIEIFNPIGAADAIALSLFRIGLGTGDYHLDKVTYETREGDFLETSVGLASPFIKGVNFAHQEEYRFIFPAKKEFIEPTILEVNWPTGIIGDVKDWLPR